MKKALYILLVFIAFIFTGCGHQVSTVGVGTSLNIGGGEYGSIRYADGLLGNFVTKDGIDFTAELDSTAGFTFDPSSNTYKGIKAIRYSVAPQITGYAVDFANKNPDVAKVYYEALGKYYEAKYARPAESSVSDEKSTEATKSVADTVKNVIEKVKNKLIPEGKPESLDVDTDDKTISVQIDLIKKLLAYADDTTKNSDGILLKENLTELEKLYGKMTEKGKKKATIGIKRANVKDKKLTDLVIVRCIEDKCENVSCVGCISWDVLIDEAK